MVLFYIRFISDGHSIYDSSTFVSRWTFTLLGPLSVEVMYSVAVVSIVIEFWKRGKPVLHSFHIRWIFVLRSNYLLYEQLC